MKYLWLVLAVSVAGAQTYYDKTTIPPTGATNTVIGNKTSATAAPTYMAVGTCSTAASALKWTTNTGFGCNTSIDAATLLTGTWAAPGSIGSGTPAAGAFTTLTSSSGMPLSSLATQATNTVAGNATSGTAVPTALPVGTCSTAASALKWTTNTGFGCNTAIDATTLGTATFAAPGAIGSGTPSTGAFTTLSSTSALKVNGVSAPYTLFHWGMPLILPGGGTFTTTPSAASGLTLTTALPNLAACSATVGCFMYFPVNTICTAGNCGGGTSQAAGAYYAQCADTTHCKVFNNRLDAIATGIPATPASPTSFGTITTTGAYVQTVNSRLALTTVTVPAGAMGANGSLELEYRASRFSAATTCKVAASFGGSDVGFVGVVSVAWIAYKRSIQNLGDAASQAVFPISNGSPSDFTSVNTGATFTSVNSANATSLTVEGLITASATEWLVVYGVDVKVINAT